MRREEYCDCKKDAVKSARHCLAGGSISMAA